MLPILTLEQNIEIIDNGIANISAAYLQIRDNKQYKKTHDTFEAFCQDTWCETRQSINRKINYIKVLSVLEPMGSIPATERQTREISKATEEEQAEVWQTAQEETGKDQPTAKEIKQVIESRKEDGSFHISSGNNDWYTPSGYIESARNVLGGIDLDPASSELAQETVKATTHYTKETDGLDKKWSGTVWMNPPYSMPEIQLFIDKLLSEDVGDWIVLTNNSSDTGWFHKLLDAADYVCFTKGRIGFEYKDETMATRQGQTFFYKGSSEEGFIEEFKAYGAIMEVIHVHAP